MRYTCEIIIDLPREEVIRKLDNPDNMKHWQRGLISHRFTEGTPGQVGAKMELEYQMGKRNLKMTETIIENNFPSAFHATYTAKGVHNVQNNFFHEESDGQKTRWESQSEFELNSLGMKVMAWLMPGAFKKQSMKYLQDFKDFAENGTSVAGE